MSGPAIAFDHVHLISEEPHAAAAWYQDMLGGEIAASYETRGAVQIRVTFGAVTILIRGRRPGETPGPKTELQTFNDYVSHDQWGTDHFGFSVAGDLRQLCTDLKAKGAELAVEPYEFLPGRTIAYLKAPDGVTVELTEAAVDA